MRKLLVGLLIGSLPLSAATQRAAVAQEMQMKKCAKCGQTSITAQSKCLLCGTPYGAPAPKAKAKEAPAKSKPAAAKPKPGAQPAKSKEKPATGTQPAKTIAPAKPAAATMSPRKPAPVVKAPAKPAPPMTGTHVIPTLTVELPANPYETGLTSFPVKGVARNVRPGTKVELLLSPDGKIDGKHPKLASQVADKNPYAIRGTVKLERAGVDYRVLAVAIDGNKTYLSEPAIVRRKPQTLPKLASAGASAGSTFGFEAYIVEGGSERILNASDPALPIGKHTLKFYSPSRGKPAMVSKPVEVEVGAAGRLSSPLAQVALDPLSGSLHVTVMRQAAPVKSATVQLAAVADPQKSFTLASSADGTYRFSELPVGKYRLTVNEKLRQEVDVTGGPLPGAVTVAIAPSTLGIVASIADGNVVSVELVARGSAGDISVSPRPTLVEPGVYELSLSTNDAVLWQLVSPSKLTVGDEQSVHHPVALRRRQGAFIVRVALNEQPPRTTITLRPKDRGWPGANARSLTDLNSTGVAQGPLQVGDYEFAMDEAERDEWEPATILIQADNPAEVTLRRRLGALTIATVAKSDSASFNEKDLRFDLRKPDGTVRSVLSGTMVLPRGNYEVSVDPKTVPKGWRLAGAAMWARVPVDSRVLFALEPNTARLTLQKLLAKKDFLVQIDNEKAQLLEANERGEINVAMTPGVHTVRVASLDYEFLDFVKKVQAPEQATLPVNFVADEGEVSIARGESVPPRRSRIEVTLDFPVDATWARYVKDRGVTLPKRVEVTYSRDGRLLLPANLALPPAPYLATTTWSEESSVVRTEVGIGGKQELKFEVAKRAVSAKGEIVWKPPGSGYARVPRRQDPSGFAQTK